MTLLMDPKIPSFANRNAIAPNVINAPGMISIKRIFSSWSGKTAAINVGRMILHNFVFIKFKWIRQVSGFEIAEHLNPGVHI